MHIQWVIKKAFVMMYCAEPVDVGGLFHLYGIFWMTVLHKAHCRREGKISYINILQHKAENDKGLTNNNNTGFPTIRK